MSLFKSSAAIRNTAFGIEDGLISTVGLLSGVAAAGVPRGTVLLTGAVLIFVEAFSMAVGSFSSEREGMEIDAGKEVSVKKPIRLATIMFTSYFLAGLVPLSPYIFLPGQNAIIISIIISLIALFILGVVGGRIAKINPWRKGLQMFVIGGIAIFLGILVGGLLNQTAPASPIIF